MQFVFYHIAQSLYLCHHLDVGLSGRIRGGKLQLWHHAGVDPVVGVAHADPGARLLPGLVYDVSLSDLLGLVPEARTLPGA